jgi:hypothetical protein
VAQLSTLGIITHNYMTETLAKPIHTFRLRRASAIAALFLGAFILYALSLGPVIWLSGATPATGWTRLPAGVRFVYYPMRQIPMPEAYAHYLNLWVHDHN